MERQTLVWKMHGSVGFNESYKLGREPVGKKNADILSAHVLS